MMCGFACVCCERERRMGSRVIDVGGAGCTGAGERCGGGGCVLGGEGESDRTVVVVKRRERGQVGRRSGANLMSRVAVEVWCVRMWIAGWSPRSERERS